MAETSHVTTSHVREGRALFNFIRKRKKKQSNSSTQEFMCCVCLTNQLVSEFPQLVPCSHKTCNECLRQYFKTQICAASIQLTCPQPGCYSTYTPAHVKAVLHDEHLSNKYDEFMVRRVLMNEPDCRWCPSPDCGYAVIAAGCAACPCLECGRCGTQFCYHCKGLWHPSQTCDDARQQSSTGMPPVFLSGGDGQSEVVKKCPRCMAHVSKMDDGSCNHMTCAVCGVEFCWLCLQEVTDLHYLSPTGCTFWGKRTWSRKKRMLWQMGTLVGAPLGICLMSAVALPAILIAVPAYVGRRLNCAWKRRHASTTKRVLVVTCGVTLASLCAPAIATVSVAVGVPIMIAFVYTVVPFLICRGETCLGNGDRVQIPNSMADLNQQLAGIQEQINGHFEGTSAEPLEAVPEIEAVAEVEVDSTAGTVGTSGTVGPDELTEKKQPISSRLIDPAPLD